MNRKQKTAALVGLAVIGLMLLLPPWAVSDVQTGDLEFIGYSLFTGPPEPSPNEPWANNAGAVIYQRWLFFQVAIVGVVTAILCVVLTDKTQRGSGSQDL